MDGYHEEPNYELYSPSVASADREIDDPLISHEQSMSNASVSLFDVYDSNPTISKRRKQGQGLVDEETTIQHIPKRPRLVSPGPSELQRNDRNTDDIQAGVLTASPPNTLTVHTAEEPATTTPSRSVHVFPLLHPLLPTNPTQSPRYLFPVSPTPSDEDDPEDGAYSNPPFDFYDFYGHYEDSGSEGSDEYLTGHSGIVWDDGTGRCTTEQSLCCAEVPFPEIRILASPLNYLTPPIQSNDTSTADENTSSRADDEVGTRSPSLSEQRKSTGDLGPRFTPSLSSPTHEKCGIPGLDPNYKYTENFTEPTTHATSPMSPLASADQANLEFAASESRSPSSLYDDQSQVTDPLLCAPEQHLQPLGESQDESLQYRNRSSESGSQIFSAHTSEERDEQLCVPSDLSNNTGK